MVAAIVRQGTSRLELPGRFEGMSCVTYRICADMKCSGMGCGLPDVAQGTCPRGWPRESAANPTVLSLPRLGGNVTHTG